MVSLAQLVLDDHRVPSGIFRYEVDAEGASSLFALGVRKRQAHGITEHIDVLLQPPGEVVCLVFPHLPKWIVSGGRTIDQQALLA
jgi:hypothetical protein